MWESDKDTRTLNSTLDDTNDEQQQLDERMELLVTSCIRKSDKDITIHNLTLRDTNDEQQHWMREWSYWSPLALGSQTKIQRHRPPTGMKECNYWSPLA